MNCLFQCATAFSTVTLFTIKYSLIQPDTRLNLSNTINYYWLLLSRQQAPAPLTDEEEMVQFWKNVKRITVAGNKDDQKMVNNLCLFNNVVVVMPRTTLPSGILPVSVLFSEGAMMVEICLSSMHPTTLEILKEIMIIELLPDVTERCYQVKVIYQISLI